MPPPKERRGSSAVEQENHNLLVGGSNPSPATNIFCVAKDGSSRDVSVDWQAIARANAERSFEYIPVAATNAFSNGKGGNKHDFAFDWQAFAPANAEKSFDEAGFLQSTVMTTTDFKLARHQQ